MQAHDQLCFGCASHLFKAEIPERGCHSHVAAITIKGLPHFCRKDVPDRTSGVV